MIEVSRVRVPCADTARAEAFAAHLRSLWVDGVEVDGQHVTVPTNAGPGFVFALFETAAQYGYDNELAAAQSDAVALVTGGVR